ncbi:MAG: UTP--glucose-1-phosphate uridylyltransferase [Caldilineaceae bacterium]
MHITKAVITAAGRNQRTLPLQTLIDRDGREKSVLAILIEEVQQAGIDDICVVVQPGDEEPYAAVAGRHAARLHFIHQTAPLGYGHAIYSAAPFVSDDPSCTWWATTSVSRVRGCAQQQWRSAAEVRGLGRALADLAALLRGHRRAPGGRATGPVREWRRSSKTDARRGRTAAHRLRSARRALPCFFGMHVLTPSVMTLLASRSRPPAPKPSRRACWPMRWQDCPGASASTWPWSSAARYDVGVKYGLLSTQLALAGRKRGPGRGAGAALEFTGPTRTGPAGRSVRP